jgi:hypothetical protein
MDRVGVGPLSGRAPLPATPLARELVPASCIHGPVQSLTKLPPRSLLLTDAYAYDPGCEIVRVRFVRQGRVFYRDVERCH